MSMKNFLSHFLGDTAVHYPFIPDTLVFPPFITLASCPLELLSLSLISTGSLWRLLYIANCEKQASYVEILMSYFLGNVLSDLYCVHFELKSC